MGVPSQFPIRTSRPHSLQYSIPGSFIFAAYGRYQAGSVKPSGLPQILLLLYSWYDSRLLRRSYTEIIDESGF